ncbi:sigma-70 family RNA polymerase sigma factor [Beijerinckia sp. L45]|uniref:sigma-70 family RNA polymerase sigma factor n=1 Tax=Beijerinckia sp. L45 TaxID=1641855 RepID=UPI001AED3FAC|nr:sigma-70 family RNA polymerase sigma factor [Beijerinckia sp. L45]
MIWLGGRDRSAQASRAAADTIILPHLDSAHNLARWLVHDASLAEDVVQDAVARALTYIASYDGGDARAWLMKIVRNVAYDALAVRKRRQAVHVDTCDADGVSIVEDLADPADDPEVRMSRQQDRDALVAALAGLPTELRECLVLRELEEVSYKQIAAITGVPVGTVMSRLWRARRDLMAITKGSAR